MFFSRYKEKLHAAIAENAAYFAACEKEIVQEIAEAKKMTDAGERYIALTALEEKIRTYKQAADQKVSEKIEETHSAKKMSQKGTMIGLVGGGVLASAALLPVAAATVPAIMIGGVMYIAGIRLAAAGKNPNQKNIEAFSTDKKNFCEAMETLSESIAIEKKSIIQNELPALGASPRFDDLYDHYPAVRDAFIKASAKEIVAARVAKTYKPAYPKK